MVNWFRATQWVCTLTGGIMTIAYSSLIFVNCTGAKNRWLTGLLVLLLLSQIFSFGFGLIWMVNF